MDDKKDLKDLVERAMKQCRKQEQQFRNERKRWEQIAALLSEAECRPFALLSELDALKNIGTAMTDTVENLRNWVNQKAQDQLGKYGDLLRAALADDKVHVEGRFPEYRVNLVVAIAIDERICHAKIGTRFHEVRIKGDISVKTVADAVRQELKRLFGRPLEQKQFLEELFRAYQLALTKDQRAARIGEPVSIFDVHKFVLWLRQSPRLFQTRDPGTFLPYLPDEFAVDIGRLLADSHTETAHAYRLCLHPVRNPKEALFIVNFATGMRQNYGLISFKRRTD